MKHVRTGLAIFCAASALGMATAQAADGNLRYSITVSKFENEAGWAGQWEIGDASQTPEFRKYQELRNSPQYVAAVQARLSGDTALASKAGGAQAAE